ncbi:hypothetical protein ACFC1R_23725 [Kitasatospora sp. NPDC056138]|uniref:hypothetical protein n=1 Tax=Kitasatospora sp. NPDC056138 TaxID=3345724 RepID=UPI0035E05B06
MTDIGHGGARSTGAGTSSAEVPEEVGRLAAANGLGELLDVRRGISPKRAVAVGWGTAAVSLALVLALGSETVKTSMFSFAHSILHALTIAFLFMTVGGIGYGVRGLVAGARAQYLYADGIVHLSRSGPRAVKWPDVAQLRSVHQRGDQSTVGRVVGYRLEPRDGAAFLIPLVLVDGRDAFVDQVVAAVRRHNRPII